MTGIKPSSHGIVVEHKRNGLRYAVSDRNYNEKIHRKVRDLLPGESVYSYRPKRPQDGSEAFQATPAPSQDAGSGKEDLQDVQQDSQTEGANTGTQEKKGK